MRWVEANESVNGVREWGMEAWRDAVEVTLKGVNGKVADAQLGRDETRASRRIGPPMGCTIIEGTRI